MVGTGQKLRSGEERRKPGRIGHRGRHVYRPNSCVLYNTFLESIKADTSPVKPYTNLDLLK